MAIAKWFSSVLLSFGLHVAVDAVPPPTLVFTILAAPRVHLLTTWVISTNLACCARCEGLPIVENRVQVPHTSGANDQFVIAGSGQRAPLPGYHRMSTGEHVRNDEQHGGAPTLLFGPGDTIQATPVTDKCETCCLPVRRLKRRAIGSSSY